MGKIIAGYFVPHPPIIIPEVGGETRKKVQKTIDAMERMARELAAEKPTTIIMTTPHGPSFRDYFYIPDEGDLYGDFSKFASPDLSFEIKNNISLAKQLDLKCQEEDFPGGFLSEKEKKTYLPKTKVDHGALVPWYFIEKELKNVEMLYLPVPYQSIDQMMRFGELIAEVVEASDERVIFMASGDLSHSLTDQAPAGFNPAGKRYDQKIRNIIENIDEQSLRAIDEQEMEEASECGTRSLAILWGSLRGQAMASEVYSYEGTFGVGYLVAKLYQKRKEV